MRLLVLDGSRVLPTLVRRVSPQGTDVVEATTFSAAVELLQSDPPDALIVNVSPVDLPWQLLKTYCQRHDPKIPVLFESCVYREPSEAGLDDLNHSAYFLAKPYSIDDLRMALRLLIKWIEKRDSGLSPGPTPGG